MLARCSPAAASRSGHVGLASVGSTAKGTSPAAKQPFATNSACVRARSSSAALAGVGM